MLSADSVLFYLLLLSILNYFGCCYWHRDTLARQRALSRRSFVWVEAAAMLLLIGETSMLFSSLLCTTFTFFFRVYFALAQVFRIFFFFVFHLCINKYYLSHFFTSLCFSACIFITYFICVHFFFFVSSLFALSYVFFVICPSVYVSFLQIFQPSIKWLNTSRWMLCATNTDSYERREDTRIPLLLLLLWFSIG